MNSRKIYESTNNLQQRDSMNWWIIATIFAAVFLLIVILVFESTFKDIKKETRKFRRRYIEDMNRFRKNGEISKEAYIRLKRELNDYADEIIDVADELD